MKAVNIVSMLAIICLLAMFFMFCNNLFMTAKDITPDSSILQLKEKPQEEIQGKPPAQRPLDKQIKLVKKDRKPLNLELVATFIDIPEESLAFIKDKITGYERAYKIGDRIKDAVLSRILLSKVIFIRGNGKEEILKITSHPGIGSDIITKDDDKTIIHKRSLILKYRNLNNILKEVTLRPAFSKGKMQGLKISRLKEDSIAKEAGFKENDIIKEVNNFQIIKLKDAMNIYKAIIRQAKTNPDLPIKVTLEREGKPKTLTYDVVD